MVQVQFGTKATDVDFRKWHRVSKIVIHPDYWQVGFLILLHLWKLISSVGNLRFLTGSKRSGSAPRRGLGYGRG